MWMDQFSFDQSLIPAQSSMPLLAIILCWFHFYLVLYIKCARCTPSHKTLGPITQQNLKSLAWLRKFQHNSLLAASQIFPPNNSFPRLVFYHTDSLIPAAYGKNVFLRGLALAVSSDMDIFPSNVLGLLFLCNFLPTGQGQRILEIVV